MAQQVISTGGMAPRARRSKGTLALWLLTLGALGFGGFVLFHLVGSLTAYRWTETPCTVLSSRLVDHQDGSSGKSFRLEVRYEFTFAGQTHRSEDYNWRGDLVKGPRNWSDYSAAARELERFRAGTVAVCFVDPKDPSRAILVRDDIWIHLLMLGLTAMLWFLLKAFYLPRKPRMEEIAPVLSAKPISLQNARLKDSRHWILIGGLALPMAAFLSWMSIVQPMRESRAARLWVETPATVVSSEVRTTESRHGPNYSVNVLYAYAFNGREYRANRFAFGDGPESRLSAVTRIVARYPPGAKIVCFVNPADPSAAVLNRAFKLTPSLGIGISLFMAGSAVLCLLVGLALRFGVKVPAWLLGHVSTRVGAPAVAPDTDAPVTLKAETASVGRLLVFLAGAVICFAFIGYMVWDAVPAWRETGRFEISMHGLLFIVVAGLFGVAALSKCWEFFNPQPTLCLSRGTLPLGGGFDLEWKVSGNVARLRDLTFNLEAREEIAQSQEEMTHVGRQNKDVTVKQVFFTRRLAAPATLDEKRAGVLRVDLPAGLMPSFDGHKNKIIWSITVRAEVKLGPKMNHDFKLRVLPAAA